MATDIDKPARRRPLEWDGRRHKGAAFMAGAVAGMSMTITMLLLLLLGVTPRSLANLVADRIAVLAGAGITEFFIQTIGALGKQMLFLMVLLGQVVVGGLLGLLFARISNLPRRREVWRNAFALATGFWFVFILLGFPLLDLGLLGAGLGKDQISTLVISFLLFQLFGLTLGYAYLYLVPPTGDYDEDEEEEDDAATQPAAAEASVKPAEGAELAARQDRIGRRRFVAAISGLFVLVVGAAIGSKAFGPQISGYRATLGLLRPDGTPEGEITPTPSFYQVSKNAFNPTVDGPSWKLEINGLVNRPLTFNLATLRARPRVEVVHTLTCISNPVGGDLIGNARWSGIPLKTLLQEAGVGRGVEKVVFTCADGYKDSITIEKALEDNTLLALEMNGAPLNHDHGFPGRLLIPDIYGMKNAKWVTDITLIDTEFEGFWQKQGWDNLAQIRAQSAFTYPPDNGQLKAGETSQVRGIAYAGSRPVERVEVSFDNGQTWQNATVKERLSANAWTLWRYDWTPPAGSRNYILKVRAVEAGGRVQDSVNDEPFPAGSSGYHTIGIRAI